MACTLGTPHLAATLRHHQGTHLHVAMRRSGTLQTAPLCFAASWFRWVGWFEAHVGQQRLVTILKAGVVL